MGNLPHQISPEELYEYTHSWTALRLRSFPLWDFDDIRNEAYVAGISLLSGYDSGMGTVHQYLSQRLYDYVSRSYYKKNDIVVTRKMNPDGSKGKREYRPLCVYVANYADLPMAVHYDPEPHDFPDLSVLPDSILEVAYILSQGGSQKKCATIQSVSEPAISRKVRKLRDVLIGKKS